MMKPTKKPIRMIPYLIIFLLCMSVLPPSMDALSKTGLSTAKFALIVEAASSSVVDIVEAVVVVSISKFAGCLRVLTTRKAGRYSTSAANIYK